MENFTRNPWTEVRVWAQFFNILLFYFVAGILFFLTGRLCLSLRILASASWLFGLLNAYVVRFRSNPIVPWDIFSIRTAASVADNYDYLPDVRMAVVTFCFLAVFIGLRRADIRMDGVAFWKRLALASAVFAALLLFAETLQQEGVQNRYRLYNKLFTPAYMTKVDGIAVTLTMDMAYLYVERPDGYSDAEAKELLEAYGVQDEMAEEELPNIIVVMDEAFSDLGILGELQTNRDYMPYLHGLQQGADNTVTGMLHVSVCGGNTANTEFEFLTGHTMAFLPPGSIPYQQYITNEMPSLASHLRDLGYETVASHPYGASGWERDTVYPLLGFSESLFREAYDGAERVRQYVSDAACVDRIIRLYEEKDPDVPLFSFTVTMQNHSGYKDTYANFTPDITVEGVENTSLEQYLSLLALSDEALEKLITYFAGQEEKTIIVFFGDHQPSDAVAAQVFTNHGPEELRYQVPYLIWANYEIEAETGADTSANYLGAEVLKRAGVARSGYQNFLLELKEEYPVLSAMRLQKADGSETTVREETKGLSAYRILQYYQIFEK